MNPITAIVSVLVLSMGSAAPPTARDYPSENRQFVVHVRPAEKGSKSWFEVFRVQGDERISLWRHEVGNETCPGHAYISNDGNYVVTRDEWGRGRKGASGDYVLAFYQKTGLIRRYSLAEIIQCQGYIDVSNSSAGRRWASEVYLQDIEGRTLLCIWPRNKPDYWLAWDVSTGSKVNVFPETTKACNKTARQWAFARLMQAEKRNYDLYAALRILGRLKRPEDRKHVEPFLESEDFYSGYSSSKRVLKEVYCYSNMRSTAERSLAALDGDYVTGRGGSLQTYGYLGVVKGTITLPRVPEPGDRAFYVHLIPASTPKGQWYQAHTPYRLRGRFSKYSTPASASIPFAFYHVTPGQYHVKAVWDIAEPHSFREDRSTGAPSPGDYENQLAPLVWVRAGETVRQVTLDCTQQLSEASTSQWASGPLPQSAQVKTPCPCGEEHHDQRVCMVFDQPMPMRPFNHGPYHNFAGARLVQDGDRKTYTYTFAKEVHTLSTPEEPQFDMGIQMVIVNDKLARVTVEGPYFAVVPLRSFLRALMIDTTDLGDAALESYTLHGKLMPRLELPEPLHRVTQILGRPSNTRGNEVTFSYGDQRLWIKFETSSNGLVLRCRTNLAGGTSFYGVSSRRVM